MHVLIPGGTGLIGTALTEWLVRNDHSVTILSRSPNRSSYPGVDFLEWSGESTDRIVDCMSRVDAVVNLAGANLAARRWTEPYKRIIRESRLVSVQALVKAIEAANRKPETFVQASAVGYYGSNYSNEILTERLPAGTDFLATVCKDWEFATSPLRNLDLRLTFARIGIVLSKEGGALPRMLPPFRLGIGGAMGDGKQPFPWIHLQDTARALAFLTTNENALGPYNLTGPQIVSNREFSHILARTLKRPTCLDVPALAVRMLFGDMSVLLLSGQRAVSCRLQDAGFSFQFQEVQAALEDILS